MIFDDNNNSSNSGNKSKWNDRLSKMRRDRLRKKKYGTLDEKDEFTFKDLGRNVLKVILVMPSVIYTNVTGKDKVNNNKRVNNGKKINISSNDNSKDKKSVVNVGDSIKLVNENLDDTLKRNGEYQEYRRFKVDKIKDINVSSLKRNRDLLLKNSNLVNDSSVRETADLIDVEIRKRKLQKEIVDLIKKKLVNNINELEMLQSELYVLNELDNGDIYLDECKQDVKEVKKLLSKVKALKEKYDYLKDNVDFEYMLEYGDDFLVDKILELKDICSRSDIKHTVEDYKILEEYKFLYLKIDKLQENTIKLEEYKSNKVEELKQRDIDFDEMKSHLYDVDREKERYDDFVKRQEIIFEELNDKIAKIDSHEEVTYRLKGFNQLLGNSFKYLGLLLVNPLKGLVPGIATQTLVTKNMVRNLYKNLEWEEDRRMVYDAIDYSNEINIAINNLDSTSSLVDSTLEDIVRLKSKYMNEFSQYEGSFSSYKDAIKKLNKIENAVLGNKIKIENMKIRMREKERQNENKLKMVKKLNSSSNN